MPDDDPITRIIDQLERVKMRPALYLGSNEDVGRLSALLQGIAVGLHAFGQNGYDRETLRAVLREHGWTLKAYAPEHSMRKRGLSEEQIVQELLTVEIECWRRVLAGRAAQDGAEGTDGA